jgi:branched-chain amino acid transport system substrate-binding protein
MGRGAAQGLIAVAVTSALAACGGALSDATVQAEYQAHLSNSQLSNNGHAAPSAAVTTLPTVGPAVGEVPAGPTGTAGPAAGPVSRVTTGSLTGGPATTGPSRVPGSRGALPSRSGKPVGPASAPGPGTPGETGPILIGSVGNYSGAPGVTLAGLARGVQVWAAMVNNSGGLFGRQVRVIVEDDGGDPSAYGSDVQDLVENRHVVAFVAQGALLSSQGGADYLKSHGIPIIGSDCSRPDAFDFPNVFQQCATPSQTINSIFKILKKITGVTKVGDVYCIESATCAETKNDPPYAEANGMKIVYSEAISIATIDFTSNCQAAQQAGAEAFIVAADPSTLQRFAQSCVRQNYRPQYFTAAIGAISSSNQVDGLQNLLLPSYVFPFAGVTGNPAIDEYSAAMAKYDKNEPVGPASAQGWAAAKLFQLAATRAATNEHTISSRSLTAALKTIKNETLGGLTVPLNFTTFPATPAGCAFTVQSDPATKRWAAPLGDALTC